jgi:hypothetical protein
MLPVLHYLARVFEIAGEDFHRMLTVGYHIAAAIGGGVGALWGSRRLLRRASTV